LAANGGKGMNSAPSKHPLAKRGGKGDEKIHGEKVLGGGKKQYPSAPSCRDPPRRSEEGHEGRKKRGERARGKNKATGEETYGGGKRTDSYDWEY